MQYTSRVGKISRLPLIIREEINRRLQDWQTARSILPWLNELPEVCEILTREFGGDKITDSNISRWRLGGYQDWLNAQASREQSAKPATASPEPRWCPAGPDF